MFHHDPKAPKDSLDFVLKAKYDQHEEFLRAKNETLSQPETQGDDHGYEKTYNWCKKKHWGFYDDRNCIGSKFFPHCKNLGSFTITLNVQLCG